MATKKIKIDVTDASAVYKECARRAKAEGIDSSTTVEWGTAIAKHEADVFKENGDAPNPVAPKLVAPKPVAPKPVAAKPVAAKPVAAKPVAAKPVKAEDCAVNAIAKRHGFRFQRAEAGAFGYTHRDGRALVCAADATGAGFSWKIAEPDNGGQRGGTAADAKALRCDVETAIKASAKSVREMSKRETRSARLVARDAKSAAVKQTKLAASRAVVASAPPQEMSAVVELVGKLTGKTYKLSTLRGDAKYGARLKLAKRILGDEARAADAGIEALTKELRRIVDVPKSLDAKSAAVDFATTCKAIAAAADKARKAVKVEEGIVKAAAMRDTLVARSVPGKIVEPFKKKGKMEIAAELAATRAEFAPGATPRPTAPRVETTFTPPKTALGLYEKATGHVLHVEGELARLTREQVLCDESDVATGVYFAPAEAALLEHMSTGLVVLRLANPGLHGGVPVIYNNGRAVSFSFLSLATAAKYSKVEDGDVVAAAKILLSPAMSSVKIEPVAKRHLDAVVNSKEMNEMAEATKSTKKFAPPAKAAKKATKAAKPAKEKKEAGERKTSLFRLSNATAKEWGAFTAQKGLIVAAFKKLGAIGAKAPGITRGALIAALPNVPPNNVSFYLSKWQAPKFVEKLAPAE